jgi:hypothetical protein
MSGRRTVVGLCMLCALAFTGSATESAFAFTNGTTAFTCRDVGTNNGTFKKAHCKVADAGTGNFEHVAIAQSTRTEVTGNNVKTGAGTSFAAPWKINAVIGGVETEIQAKEVHGLGWLENDLDEGDQHYAHGTGTLALANVVFPKPSGKGCKVFTGAPGGEEGVERAVDSRPLLATTASQGDFVKVEGEETDSGSGESLLAVFHVECASKVPFLEGEWKITGSVKCPVDGATVVCSAAETAAQGSLKAKGVKVGLEGALTVSGRLDESETTTPLSATTVETP